VKKWFPTKKALGVWMVAVVLALWSLPNAGDLGTPKSGAHDAEHSIGGAIPTLAVPADNQPGTAPPQQQAAPPSTTPAQPPADRQPDAPQNAQLPQPTEFFSPYLPWPTAKLRVRVIDGRTQRPLSGAEVVIIETEQRVTTGADGYTPWMDVPIIRNPRFRPMVAELHGQLGAIAYKNGYRDSIHLGIRMHEGIENEATIWMYRLGPGDSRIEPVLYQVPYHRIWLVELADKFRSKTQPGEGPERP
jgi:hypothetical protein